MRRHGLEDRLVEVMFLKGNVNMKTVGLENMSRNKMKNFSQKYFMPIKIRL
jgi:hypothetical protein